MIQTRTEPQHGSVKLVALASLIGTTIEWYDFFLYGTAAALVFNRLFFPNSDPLMGTLYSFGTFAVGFFARPVGGEINRGAGLRERERNRAPDSARSAGHQRHLPRQ